MKWKILVPIILALLFFGFTAMNKSEVEVSEVIDIAINETGDVFILERTTIDPFRDYKHA